jgi:hypothetical protein
MDLNGVDLVVADYPESVLLMEVRIEVHQTEKAIIEADLRGAYLAIANLREVVLAFGLQPTHLAVGRNRTVVSQAEHCLGG